MNLILKSAGAPFVLQDVGVIIEPSSGSTFSGIPGLIRMLGQSVALRTLVGNSSVVVNNGSIDLSPLEGQQYLNQLWTQAGGDVSVQMSNVEGAISDFQHGSKTLGTLHAVATQSVAGFMSSTDKTKLDGLTLIGSATVQTTDATPTTLATIPITADSSCVIDAHVSAKQTSSGTTRAGYVVQALVYRIGAGAATRQGTDNALFTRESTATMDATVTTSGNDAIVQVTGVAATTINWKATYRTTEVSG